MSVNPNALQLMQSKYSMYQKLLEQRADLDTKIMIVATDIAQIVSAAMPNAPIGGIEEPRAPAPKAEAPKATVQSSAPVQPKVETPAPAPQAEAPIYVPTQEEAQNLATQVIAKHGPGKMAELKIAARGPYSSQTDAMKVETIKILKDALDG